MLFVTLAVFTHKSNGQVLIDDHMEGYPTATASSVYPGVEDAVPANWQTQTS